MRSPRLVAALVALVLLAPATLVVSRAAPAAAAPLPCATRDPFAGGVAQSLAARYLGRHFTAQVYDQATGCVYDLNPGRVQTTASVAKLEIMAAILLRAQQQGRGLTAWERSQLWPMITQSDDAAANALYTSLGGPAVMDAYSRTFGMYSTASSWVWGLTTTTAADQIRLVRQVLAGEYGPLTAPYRAEARYYTGNVVPSQRWGASAGVPAGWSVFQKNGFAPSGCCGWRLNTVGWVERPGGPGWALALLTDGWGTEAEGIAAVDALGGQINRAVLAAPFGSLDRVTPVGGAQVAVAGWAADPSDNASLAVHVYVDGAFAGAFPADAYRPDVAAAFPAYGGAHGFNAVVSIPDGTHQVCAYAINLGPLAPNPAVGCGLATVRVSPIGSLDLAQRVPGGLRVAGWAWDPDSSAPIAVHVYVDGAFATATLASGWRPDVAAAFPTAGPEHGFDVPIGVAAGMHTVCAYGINLGPGANATLGCRTVTVGSLPIGSLDAVAAGAGQVVAAGWGLDPDTAASIAVHVYVDGQFGTAVAAAAWRPDVAAAYSGYGAAHGFNAAMPTSTGPHTVCVYGINVGAGGNSLLGCRAVTA